MNIYLNKKFFYNVVLTLSFISILGSCTINAQESETEMKNRFFFIIGQGYEDGLVSISRIPTIGFGYERKLNDYFSFYVRILSHYTNGFDNDESYISQIPPYIGIDFNTDENNILTINNMRSLNQLSVPLDVGIRFTPLHFNRHSLSINFGWGIAYETYNRWKDVLAVKVYTDEGILYQNGNYITVQTEHHHIISGEQIGISYQYDFKKSSLALYFGENYGYFGPTSSSYFYELSLMYKIHF